MPSTYRTSNNDFVISLPSTQEDFLNQDELLIPDSKNSYAPIRNKHTYSVMLHDDLN